MGSTQLTKKGRALNSCIPPVTIEQSSNMALRPDAFRVEAATGFDVLRIHWASATRSESSGGRPWTVPELPSHVMLGRKSQSLVTAAASST